MKDRCSIMATYTLRKMHQQDYELVYNMKKEAFKRYVIENWGSWDATRQRDYFKHFVEKYKDNIWIIQVNHTPVGFFAGQVIGNGNYHLGTIVIIPEYQGQGIGTQVLRNIIKKNHKRNIEIKYFKKNPVGHLYSRLGFVKYGETQYHYHVIKWHHGHP